MKITKKHFKISILVICIIFTLSACCVSAYDSSSLSAAQTLYNLGLLKGNSEIFSAESMELDSYATRAQLAVTITRMLGKDEKAKYQQNSHPFSDVPDWAGDYVGWLYENYLVNGISDTYFGASDLATTNQFCAMILRVLDYRETDGDFLYENATKFAVGLNLIDNSAIYKYELLRGDMVKICLNALKTPLKDSKRTLAQKLCDEKVFSKALAEANGLAPADALSSYFAHVENTIGKISSERRGVDAIITFENPQEEYGIRVFYISDIHPTVTEIPLNTGNTHFEKGPISYPGGSAAGYINKIYIKNIPNDINGKIIVIKASSEGAIYTPYGKSDIIWI